MSKNKYCILAETNGGENETWYYFIKYNENKNALKHLKSQLDTIKDMVIIDIEEIQTSVFTLDLENLVNEKTAKEMTKININSFTYHRKFDGILNSIHLRLHKIKKEDDDDDEDINIKKLIKLHEKLGMGQIEDYISKEDINSDISDNEFNSSYSDETDYDSDYKEEVELPTTDVL